MALIAVGIAGYDVSLRPFLDEQKDRPDQATGDGSQLQGEQQIVDRAHDDDDDDGDDEFCGECTNFTLAFIVILIGAIALPFIKAWSVTFGIPAICTALATFLFLSGWSGYRKVECQGWSPLTSVCRVFWAAAFKKSRSSPIDPNQLYKKNEQESFSDTRFLRCLEKAAIIPSHGNPEDQVKRWRLCSVAEVEDAKIAVRMIPMWLAFIVCGIVSSVRNTYFVEQANHMNRKLGSWKVPIEVILLLCGWNQEFANLLTNNLLVLLNKERPAGDGSTFLIKFGMVSAVLSCITAAGVETKRLKVIRRHGLLDKPDEDIPMTVLSLLPQFSLYAWTDFTLQLGIGSFYMIESPESMTNYQAYFGKGVAGLGYLSSVWLVYVVGKVSEKGRGKTKNWFQFTLNRSRLDRYYWMLAALGSVNLLIFSLVACCYRFKNPAHEEVVHTGESAQDDDDTDR